MARIPKAQKPLGRAKTPELRARAEGTTQREKYEANNPERGTSLQDRQFSSHGITQSPRDVGMSHIEAYRAYGLHDLHTTPHVPGQTELPGMRSVMDARQHGVLSTTATPAHQSRTLPDLAPASPRWEDMHPQERKNVVRKAASFGVTPESMHQNLGAQVDQAYMRGGEHGMTPYASHFYSGKDPSRPDATEPSLRGPAGVPGRRIDHPDMQPRERLMASAQEMGVDFGTQVMANAMTSPKAKFRHRTASTGRVSYPNDEAATEAVAHTLAGGTPDNYVKPRNLPVMTGNIKRAAHATNQRLNEGRAMEEVSNPPNKTGKSSAPFGPKTGPYNNSFMDPHGSSQFFVSDVHSGGGGMAPHIPHSSAFKRDEEGVKVQTAGGRDAKVGNTPREQYLAIPGIHSLHDYTARNVARERGLGSVAAMQGAQWGEEQLARGESGGGGVARKQTLVTTADAYARPAAVEHVEGQIPMFGAGAPKGARAGKTTYVGGSRRSGSIMDETEEPTGQERVRAEHAMAAVQRSRRT